MHQALTGGRAGNLRGDQPFRCRAGKRGVRSADARLRFQRRVQDRKHPFRLSARIHAERLKERTRRTPQEHHLSHRRRIRRDAADREAHAGAGDVSFPFRLHRQGRRHREGPGRRRA